MKQLPRPPRRVGGAGCRQVLLYYPKSATHGHRNDPTICSAEGFYSSNLIQSIHIFPVV